MRHNVVAYLALFVALSGSAVAAAPLITGAKVQDESLTGADVLNDSLKGADVDESNLGSVPSATRADNGVLDSGVLTRDWGGELAPGACATHGLATTAPPGKTVVVSFDVFNDPNQATSQMLWSGTSTVAPPGVFGNRAGLKLCNVSASPVTPGTLTAHWRVLGP